MEDKLLELKGSLRESKVPDLIYSISQAKATGVLYLTREDEKKALYFNKGRIVFAKSNSIDDRLGEQLLKQKKITYRQLEEASKLISQGKRLGTILVEQNIIDSEELVQAIIGQIKNIIISVFQWNKGEYLFKPGELPTKEVIILNISTEDIVMMGIQSIDRWSWIKQAVGGLDAYYKISGKNIDSDTLFFSFPQAAKIIEFLKEEHTVEQICEFSSIGDFETCKLLWVLSVLGFIEKIAVPLISIEEKLILEEEKPRELKEEVIKEKEMESVSADTKEYIEPSEVIEEQEIKKETLEEKEGVILSSEDKPIIELSFSDLADLTDDEELEKKEEIEGVKILTKEEVDEKKIIQELQDFNEKHKTIYEFLRIELGSLCSDFLATALNKIKIEYPFLFDGVKYDDFGALNVEALKNNIIGNLIEDYEKGFEALLEMEIQMMRKLLEPEKIKELHQILAKFNSKI